MPKHAWPRAVVLFSAAIVVMGPLGGVAAGGQPDQADGVRVFTQDVNWLAGANLVNPDGETPPNADLFSHEGERLESAPGDHITWGEWSAATATSRASTLGGPDGPRTDVRISMQRLVPNGLYSVYWFTLFPDSGTLSAPESSAFSRSTPSSRAPWPPIRARSSPTRAGRPSSTEGWAANCWPAHPWSSP